MTVLWLLLPGVVAGQELPFAHYTPASDRNPLPSAEVNQVYQDRLGYLWFVIFSSGVVRYDGHALETYNVADGLKDLAVWGIVEDRAGRVWVASNSGLVVSERPLADFSPGERVRFVSSIGGAQLVETIVTGSRLAADADGNVWTGTSGTGIIRYRTREDGTVTADTIGTDIRGEGRDVTVRSIFCRRDGSVCAGISGGALMIFKPDGTAPVVIGQDEGLPAQSVNALCEAPNGVFWGGCRNGVLWRLDEAGGMYRVVPVSERLTSNITGILATSDTTLWVASEGAGVMKFNPARPGRSRVLTRRNGLLSDNVHHILLDSENNLWISQSGGVSKLRSNFEAFTIYTATSHTGEAPLIPSQAVNVIVPPSRSAGHTGLWLGTAEGGIACVEGDSTLVTLDADDGLRNNWVNGLVFDAEGRLWIGTSSGINCLSMAGAGSPPRSPRRTSARVLGQQAVLASYRHTSIYACFALPLSGAGQSSESLWFAGFQNLFCRAGDRWWILRARCGFPVTVFHAVAVDGRGHVWVGTRDQGLYRSILPVTIAALESADREAVDFQGDEGTGLFGYEVTSPLFERVWSREEGAPTNQIDKIVWHDRELWIGTPVGLFVFDEEPFRLVKAVSREEGLTSTNVTSLAFSPAGTLWIGTNAGLTEIDPVSHHVSRTVTHQDGLAGNEVWFFGSVAVGDDGTVYFGSAQGLSAYAPHLDAPNPKPPVVRLRALSFHEDDFGNNQLSVEYAALSYSKETRVRYRTRLVGYDRDWSPETTEFKTRYTNLPAFFLPRTYAFEVNASNGDGVWSEEPLRYAFAVSPPLWFRWWSILGQIVLVGGTAAGVFQYRTRALARRAQMLERVVDERTQEVRAQATMLQEQNVELEEKNAQIVRTQQQLIVQEKLASLGSLTAGIAHEIRNPLNFVNNFAELSGDLVDDIRHDIEKHRDKLGDDVMRDVEELLTDLQQNMTKINEHGKRANNIVQGMLLHSRGQKGEPQKTRLNAMLDEFAGLAYHGVIADAPGASVKIEKDYDDSVGEIIAVPQDLSRVFVNVVNNACYAVLHKQRRVGAGYEPTVRLATRNLGDRVEVRVRDNGDGIPDNIREKIFTPFFTTKPTGEGTGLGLSISYDIVTQEHHGTFAVDSKEGEFTEFVITLPRGAGEAA